MSVAQGISKITVIAKQAGLGSLVAGAGGQTLRRVTSVFELSRDSFENNEIVAHQQSTGVTFGTKKPNGKMSVLLSPATYKLFFAALLRKDFVVGVNTTAITTVTSASTSGAQGTFTRSSGSYLTDGFKLYDIVRWTGFATTGAANNTVNMMIISLSALIMTVTRFDTTAIGAKAAGDTVTCTVVGKKTMAPLTGHTNDYFTIEEYQPDLVTPSSELYGDMHVAKADISMPATGNATCNFTFVGLSKSQTGAQVLTSPAAATTTPVLTALNGVVWINGAAYTITGSQLAIDGSTIAGEAEVGSTSSSDLQRGRIKVSGSFTALFKDNTIQALKDAQTITAISLINLDNTGPTSSFKTFVLSQVKITTDTPDDGEKQLMRTYNFTAQNNTAGGAGLATDQTIISIQDSDA